MRFERIGWGFESLQQYSASNGAALHRCTWGARITAIMPALHAGDQGSTPWLSTMPLPLDRGCWTSNPVKEGSIPSRGTMPP